MNNGETYIWRTVGDDKVRSNHAWRAGKSFRWDTPPVGGHPGTEFGCRCWAETVPMVDPCVQLSIDLQNARLQRQNEANGMNDASQKANNLNYKLKNAFDNILKEFRNAGVDIGFSVIPGIDGKIPVVETFLEAAKGAIKISRAYKNYLRIWKDLDTTVQDQKFFQKRLEKKDDEINLLQKKMKNLNCPL